MGDLYISFDFFNINQDNEYAIIQVVKDNNFENPLNVSYDKVTKKFILTTKSKIPIKPGKDSTGIERSVLYKCAVLAQRIKNNELQEVL